MEGQKPNNLQSFTKGSNSKPRPNNNNQSQQESSHSFGQQYIHSQHYLPQTQQPSTQNPVQFYKCRQRLTSEMFSTRIGYRIRQYTRVQEDYICYLTQLIMMECQGIKVYVIEPNYLYFEVSLTTEEEKLQIYKDKEKEKQEIDLENNMFRFLKHISQQIFNPWIDQNLQSQRLTNQDFGEQKVIDSFTNEVVNKIKTKQAEFFQKGKKTKK